MAKNLSRRDFLKGAAAGALSLTAASMTGGLAFAEEEGIYTPGTYKATATGIGEIEVVMTFDANSITDVQISTVNETEGIGKGLDTHFAEAILTAQGTDIDGVSGASMTSGGVIEAANACIAQAKGEPVEVAPVTSDSTAETVKSSKWYDESYFEQPEAITEADHEFDTEVVVIGAGNGGCPAAISAADLGAQVAWVERAPGVVTWAGEMGA